MDPAGLKVLALAVTSLRSDYNSSSALGRWQGKRNSAGHKVAGLEETLGFPVEIAPQKGERGQRSKMHVNKRTARDLVPYEDSKKVDAGCSV